MEKIIKDLASSTWFKSWFDSRHYHQLYQYRDETEARKFIDALLNELTPLYGSSMLDVGCGTGRHSKYLASKGFNVKGFDLALSSIRDAKRHEGDTLHFYQHDMQIPFGQKEFDYIFNFFTSFGYFKHRHENEQVIRNMSVALKPGASLLIDYLNVQYAEQQMEAVEEKEIDGILYHINRWSDASFIYKRIAIHEQHSLKPLEYVEQVARFGVEEFSDMLSKNGLAIRKLYGDYQLNPYDLSKSKRLIILAEKNFD